MNLYNLFEAPKRPPAPGTTGVMDNQVQSAASPIGSGTSRWESKKKPVTMMGVGNTGVVAEARDVQLDEISNKILGDYKKAAGVDASAADARGDIERGNKRFRGIVKATIKQGENDAKRHKAQGVAEDTIDMPFGSISGQDVDIGLQHRSEQAAYTGLKRLGLVDTSEQFLTLQEIAKLVTDSSNFHMFAFDTNPVRGYVKLIKMIGWNKNDPTEYNLPQGVAEDSTAHDCKHCNGKGYHTVTKKDGTKVATNCPQCKGKGYIVTKGVAEDVRTESAELAKQYGWAYNQGEYGASMTHPKFGRISLSSPVTSRSGDTAVEREWTHNNASGIGDRSLAQHLQSLKEQGVAEGLPQTLRKVVPGYAKREIDKKMDAGKFGKTDADKDANFQRYKKIQDKIKEQGVAESMGRATPKMPKARDPGHAVLAAKRSSGAGGQHTNKRRQALLQPKHQKPLTRDMDMNEDIERHLMQMRRAGYNIK